MRDGGADYVVRLSAKALRLTDAQGAPLDRAALCRRAQAEVKDGGGPLDIAARVLPGGEGSKGGAALDARLICLQPPPAQAESARRTMRANARKWGYTPTDAALDAATCFMLIASLDADTFPPTRILDLHRRRWQVELAFKRLKSLLGLENLRAFDPAMASAWIHAVLRVALLIDLNRPGAQDEGPDSPPSEPSIPSQNPDQQAMRQPSRSGV